MNDFGEKAPVTDWVLVARLAWSELGEGREYGRVAEVGRVWCLVSGSAGGYAVTGAVSENGYGQVRESQLELLREQWHAAAEGNGARAQYS